MKTNQTKEVSKCRGTEIKFPNHRDLYDKGTLPWCFSCGKPFEPVDSLKNQINNLIQ